MRITFPDGTIVDADTVADAAEFIRQVANGGRVAGVGEGKTRLAEVVQAYRGPKVESTAPTQEYAEKQMKRASELSPALQEIYQYLRDNDSEEGANRVQLAEAFGLKVAAMDQRLRQLKRRGYAKQVSRGQWSVA